MTVEPAGTSAASRGGPTTAYLHIGMMKTGTSFVQDVLVRNVDLLASRGVLFPTDATRWGLQVRAARDVLDIVGARPSEGAWAALCAQVHAHDGPALVSMEFLSFADLARANRIVADLRADRVEIVVTARDIARIMPSAWQSMIKQGHPWSFDEFTRSVTGLGEAYLEPGVRFWKHHDLVQIVTRWTAVVGAEHVHLVTVPPSGAPPDLLWSRFCESVDLDPVGFDTEQDRNSNFSLAYSESELLRQVNIALAGRLSKLGHKRWAARFLANRVMRSPAGEATAHDRPALGPDAMAWAVTQSQAAVAELRRLGVTVHGDLDDLVVPARPTDVPPPPRVAYPGRSAEMIAELLLKLAAVDPQMPDDGVTLHETAPAARARDASRPRPLTTAPGGTP